MAARVEGERPVRAYLERLDPRSRAALERIQRAVLAVAPDATEGRSYGMPAFKLDGKGLAAFAAFKDHLSFFPMSGTVLERMNPDLEGFRVSKGTVQFTLEKPLPVALVKNIVRARLAEIRRDQKPRK